ALVPAPPTPDRTPSSCTHSEHPRCRSRAGRGRSARCSGVAAARSCTPSACPLRPRMDAPTRLAQASPALVLPPPNTCSHMAIAMLGYLLLTGLKRLATGWVVIGERHVL